MPPVTTDRDRRRVAVFFGGRSTEHAISCVSAGSVLAALDRSRYDVIPVGISAEGRWVLAADEPDRWAVREGVLPTVDPAGPAVMLPADPTRRHLIVLDETGCTQEPRAVDVVLPMLHGPWGEDGTVQGLLEMAGLPYVGSGVLASAAAMDKDVMKALLAAAGLPVADAETVTDLQWRTDRDAVSRRLRRLPLPVFVKPARGGSSLGISKVTSYDALPAAVEEARRCDPKVVVEAGVAGREIECGVLAGGGERPPEASLPGEIRVLGGRDFYDFDAKYLDGATELDVPAELPREVTERVRGLAVRCFEALGCEGLARVDFFVRRDGSVVVNEINTMPGFTPVSMFPRMWAASGVEYPVLLARVLDAALARATGLR